LGTAPKTTKYNESSALFQHASWLSIINAKTSRAALAVLDARHLIFLTQPTSTLDENAIFLVRKYRCAGAVRHRE